MNRREKLSASALQGDLDTTKTRMLDATIKLILGDMGQHYCKLWDAEGPGIMVFQPTNKERSMFFMTLKELHSAQESCEREDNGDLAETFRRILAAAQKINPQEKAGYLVNDNDGMRYLEIDYCQVSEK